MRDNQVVVIHCGMLNEGHNALNEKNWQIFPIKNYENIPYDKTDIIVLDEVQRIDEGQLNFIFEKMKENKICGIFSYDPLQTMNAKEKNSNSIELIKDYVIKEYKIKGRIRANKEIYFFVDNLFDKSHKHMEMNYENVYLTKFKTYKDTETFLKYLKRQGWNFINYTPSIYRDSIFTRLNSVSLGNSHQVIGQEFEKVAVIIDAKFNYIGDRLDAGIWDSGNYGAQMLYQAITRAKTSLFVIIINNDILFDQCMDIINNYKNDV